MASKRSGFGKPRSRKTLPLPKRIWDASSVRAYFVGFLMGEVVGMEFLRFFGV